jgi:hypothetical protein
MTVKMFWRNIVDPSKKIFVSQMDIDENTDQRDFLRWQKDNVDLCGIPDGHWPALLLEDGSDFKGISRGKGK